MPTTGQLGGPDSQLGNIVLADGAVGGTGGAVGVTLEARWAVRSRAAKDLEAQWDVSGITGVSLVAQWDVEAPVPGIVGKTLEVQWAVQLKATKTLVAQWTVQSLSAVTTPTTFVEIGFASDPGDETVIWTDVTQYARAVYTKRGREEELSEFSTGTASIVLDNSDRRFDPTNTASPYYPNVIPMRRVRVRAVMAGIVENQFEGFIENWPIQWNDPEDSTVTLDIADGFAVLAATKLPTTWELSFPHDDPQLWWRFGDLPGSTVAVDSGEFGFNGTYVNSPQLGQASLIPFNTDTAVSFVREQMQYVESRPIEIDGSFSVEFWIKAPPPNPLAANFQTVVSFSVGGMHFRVTNNSEFGYAGLQFYRYSGAFGAADFRSALMHSTVPVFDDQLHHVVVTLSLGTEAKIYVDGADASGAEDVVNAMNFVGGINSLVVGKVAGVGTITFTGILDEFALYDYPLSNAQALDHRNFGLTPWANDLSGFRIHRILDEIGWPVAARDIDAGESTLQATGLAVTALEHFQAVSATENGQLYMAASGAVRFRSRHSVLTDALSSSSQATFGDGAGELPYEELHPEYSVNRVFNDIRVSSQGQTTQFASDAASQATYLPRSFERSGSLTTNNAELRDQADSLLSRYKDPKLRFRSMVVKPLEDSAIWTQVLRREIGDRITVKRRPPGGGPVISVEVLIEGIEHLIQPGGDWVTTYKISQDAAQGAWVWDFSTWDQTTRWAY